MKNQQQSRVAKRALPKLLAALLSVFWAVPGAWAAEPQMTKVSDYLVEISGGSGKQAWRLRYGTMREWTDFFKPRFALAEGNRAWYCYGGWLRLIDTQKGVVIGRWHFPGVIVALAPQGEKLQVEVADSIDYPQKEVRRKFDFDPAAPHVPSWPTNFLPVYRVPLFEAQTLWAGLALGARGLPPISAQDAKKVLPEIEDAVHRDPFTPWFGVALAVTLKTLDDPRASKAFQDAINSRGADFVDLLQISAYLDGLGEQDLSRAAYNRGYRDFWQRGNDPRLTVTILWSFALYMQRSADWGNPSTPHGQELVERAYSLMPHGEAASIAWQIYADYWKAQSKPAEAKLWQARAEDARENSAFGLFEGKLGDRVDPLILLAIASWLAAILYAVASYARYRSQHRLDLAAGKRSRGFARLAAFLNAQYWPRRERFAFFTIVFLAWVSSGLISEYVGSILQRAALPISSAGGSFAGPVTIDHFENHLLPSPARDLLSAVAYQQDGRLEKAEQLYRHLPHFAESWNNLGVILKNQGKDQEAQADFERALALNPKLAEAALNLGRPAADFWTEQHQKFLPGQPMIAPPRGPQFEAAMLGASGMAVYLKALNGPFGSRSVFGFLGDLFGWNAADLLPGPTGPAVIGLALLLFAIALLFLLPSREVSLPPERHIWLWESVLPGTSPSWRWAAGFVLACWLFLLIQLLLTLKAGTPHVIMAIAMPNLRYAYGVPAPENILQFPNPSWVWIYLAPAVLFISNLALVLRARRA